MSSHEDFYHDFDIEEPERQRAAHRIVQELRRFTSDPDTDVSPQLHARLMQTVEALPLRRKRFLDRLRDTLRWPWLLLAEMPLSATAVALVVLSLGTLALMRLWRQEAPPWSGLHETQLQALRNEALQGDDQPAAVPRRAYPALVEAQLYGQRAVYASVLEQLASRADVAPDGQVSPPCYSIETSAPAVVPLNLRPALHVQDDLYWFRIHVENHCGTSLHLLVKFDVRQGPVRLTPGTLPVQFTVLPNSRRTATIDPLFEWTSETANRPLDLLWEIRTVDANTLLHTGTTHIRLLPKHYVVWDLTTPEGQRVGFDLLLSSLATWVVESPDDTTGRCTPNTTAAPPAAPMASAGVEQCYAHLFQGPTPVHIVPTSQTLAGTGTQVIKPPAHVVADGLATPLEAALLLGHESVPMVQRLGGRVALFILPQPDQPAEPPQVLIAWTEIQTGNWHALDMQQANTLAFADNETRTTPQLRHVLHNRPDILAHLERRGVFSAEGQAVVALDFTQATRRTLVYGLP